MTQEKHAQPNLKLIRFCGEELFPIKIATWHFHQKAIGVINELWLEIETDYGIQCDDTKDFEAKPTWRISLRVENLKANDIRVGFKAKVIDGYSHELEAMFYYYGHNQTDNVEIEIIEKNENKFLFRITGEVTDVNYYEGSKPKNKIHVETWFDEI